MAALEMAAVAAGLDSLVTAGDIGKKVVGAVNATNAIIEERVRSIAEKARRSIMMYKVLLSAGIRDSQIAEHITNYLERMYATFTLISLGFNPNASDNEGLNKIVDSISAESFNQNDFNADAIKRAFNTEMMYIANVNSNRKGPRIGRNAKSAEADIRHMPFGKDYDWDTMGSDIEKDMNAAIELTEHDAYDKGRNSGIKEGRELEAKDNKDRMNTAKLDEAKFIDNVSKNNDKRLPTIINMNCYVNGHSVSIPIAVKCNSYPVGSEELRLLIESGIAGKPSQFLRKLKWRSGEIGTLDYLFNLDIAKRDKKLYAKLGRNPWYRELQARKAASNTSKWGRIFNRIAPSSGATGDIYKTANNLAELNGYHGEIPPTASLIVTSDDLVAATRLNLDHFQKNDGFIAKFMKDSFLLCFGIVDLTAEQVKFFFLGYTSPFILSFKELQNAHEKDNDKTMLEIMNNLSRKV